MRYLPIGALIGFILLAELVLVFGSWVIAPELADRCRRRRCRRRAAMTNTRALGDLLYTRYIFAFQAAGMILLVAMIGAIVLTLRHRVGVRRQSIPDAARAHPRRGGRGRQGAARRRRQPSSSRASSDPMAVGLAHYLTVAAILFTLGVFGIFLNRKNVIIIMMSIELMLLAVNINFVAFSVVLRRPRRPGLRDVRADRGGGRGGDRPRHPRRLFPQPRHDRRSKTST